MFALIYTDAAGYRSHVDSFGHELAFSPTCRSAFEDSVLAPVSNIRFTDTQVRSGVIVDFLGRLWVCLRSLLCTDSSARAALVPTPYSTDIQVCIHGANRSKVACHMNALPTLPGTGLTVYLPSGVGTQLKSWQSCGRRW